jgi:hypothetical protein
MHLNGINKIFNEKYYFQKYPKVDPFFVMGKSKIPRTKGEKKNLGGVPTTNRYESQDISISYLRTRGGSN